MEVTPDTRKARNEALFREVNERIREAADRLGEHGTSTSSSASASTRIAATT